MSINTVEHITEQQEQLLIKSLAEGLAVKLKAENVVSSFNGFDWKGGAVNVEWVDTDEFKNDDGVTQASIDLSVNVLFEFSPIVGFSPTHAILVGIMTIGDCFEDKETGEYIWMGGKEGYVSKDGYDCYVLNYGYHSSNFVWGLSEEMDNDFKESYECGISYEKDDEISLIAINEAWKLLDPVVKLNYLQALFDTACKKKFQC